MAQGAADIQVLIVEDDEDDYILTAALLQGNEGFRVAVDWAPTPDTARQLLEQDQHDLCLMDYRLGAISGTDLVSEALRLGFRAPIIMLTGLDDTGVEIAAAAAGAVDYLVKDNLSREQLMRAIRYALARSEIQTERYERVRAEAASRAKSEFLAILSHEIRTPLTAIIGYTELLRRQTGQRDPGIARQLEVIYRNGEHLLSLLNDTLDLSRIEAGRLDIQPRDIALVPFIRETLALLHELASHKQLDLQLTAAQPLPAQIHTDPKRLRQILLNLLGNAIKCTEQGVVELHLRLDDSLLICEVSDTGCGIPANQLEAIFLPFTQLESGRIQGTGLGLTISRKLAERLGGSITAESTLDVGSRFTLKIDPGPLNLSPVADFDRLHEPSRPKDLPRIDIGGHVLVVDDVQDVRELLMSLLREAGIPVLGAASGREALSTVETAGAAHIALILMDLNMPGLDGFQTLAALREKGWQMPVLALTAASMHDEMERCRTSGFVACLSKPIDSDLLITEIRRYVEAAATGPGAGPPVVMLIEDNADANAAICQLLEFSGYRVGGAHDTASALALFETLRPDIVLADLHLGEEDGMVLLETLHARAPDCRYLVISGADPASQSALPDFIAGFVAKPVTLSLLEAALASVLAPASPDSTTVKRTLSSN